MCFTKDHWKKTGGFLNSQNYINKCLVKYTENTDLDLTMNLETFINSEQGIKCKQEVPNKTVGCVYNLDFSNFLI